MLGIAGKTLRFIYGNCYALRHGLGGGRASAVGHKPTFYLSFLDRLLCDPNQPLVQHPGERL